MRHKMHTYATGGYFHCASCECGRAQQLGPNNETCSIANKALNIPEESLQLFSELGIPIGWLWKEDAGKIR